MSIKITICFLLAACLCQQVASQWSQDSTTQSTTERFELFGAQPGSNSSSSNNASALVNQAPVSQFFAQVLNNQVIGLKKCKKPKDCGLGLRCDLLLNLCVPFNTPILSDIEKPCSNDSECSGMHACQGGLCRFCGPKSCRSNLDCCAGSFAEPGKPGQFYECLNIEDSDKLSLAKQLGRVPANFQPVPKSAGGKSLDDAFEVESSELIQLGLQPAAGGKNPFYGKRCWARCNVDNDCYHARTPAEVKQQVGCCNNVCSRRSTCTVLSPQVIQHAQQLQQQRIQQQQVWNQQQALLGQVHQGHGRQPQQQSQWGAGGHQQYPQQPQPQQQVAAIYVQVPVAPAKPAPQSWAEAQQQGPAAAAQPAPTSWQHAQQVQQPPSFRQM